VAAGRLKLLPKAGPRIYGARRLGQNKDFLVAGSLALEDDCALDEVGDGLKK